MAALESAMPVQQLATLQPGQLATIAQLRTNSELERRLMALGFRNGRPLEMLRKAWLAGPVHIRLGTTEVMLRRRDAQQIHVAVDKGKAPPMSCPQ